MKQDKKYIFEEAPVGKAISSFAAPMMIAMLVSVVYNLVDTFYIGLLGDYNLMAAVSLALPISTVFMGIGNIFGVGGGNYIFLFSLRPQRINSHVLQRILKAYEDPYCNNQFYNCLYIITKTKGMIFKYESYRYR